MACSVAAVAGATGRPARERHDFVDRSEKCIDLLLRDERCVTRSVSERIGLADPAIRLISFVVKAMDRKLLADAQYLDAIAVRGLVADGRNDGSAYPRFAALRG